MQEKAHATRSMYVIVIVLTLLTVFALDHSRYVFRRIMTTLVSYVHCDCNNQKGVR